MLSTTSPQVLQLILLSSTEIFSGLYIISCPPCLFLGCCILLLNHFRFLVLHFSLLLLSMTTSLCWAHQRFSGVISVVMRKECFTSVRLWADSLVPPQPGSIPTVLYSHTRVVSDTGSPHWARSWPSTYGLVSQPNLGPGRSLWGWGCPSAPDCPVPGWGGGWGSVCQNLPCCQPMGSLHFSQSTAQRELLAVVSP